MSILAIRTIGDPILRAMCRPVAPQELARPDFQKFIDDLIDTMKDVNGAGLAAPQVGRAVAVAAVWIQDNPRYPYKPNFPLTVFVNPKITVLDDVTEMIYEGCLSVPNLRGEVRRSMHIRIDALNRYGEEMSLNVNGLTAGTFQHEFDHLEGRLFVDRVEDIRSLCTWANFDVHHRADFVRRATRIVDVYGS